MVYLNIQYSSEKKKCKQKKANVKCSATFEILLVDFKVLNSIAVEEHFYWSRPERAEVDDFFPETSAFVGAQIVHSHPLAEIGWAVH